MINKFLDISWYRLSIKNQRDYAHTLNRLQHGTVLKIGPLAELNYETFSDVKEKSLNL